MAIASIVERELIKDIHVLPNQIEKAIPGRMAFSMEQRNDVFRSFTFIPNIPYFGYFCNSRKMA